MTMATKVKETDSIMGLKEKADLVREKALNNAYLKRQNADDWKEVVSILTNVGLLADQSIIMEQFSEDGCDSLVLDYITIYELFGDLRANTDKGFVYLPDVLTDEDDLSRLIDILEDGLA